jgi:hypothetical protein
VKKITTLTLAVAMIALSFVGCTNSSTTSNSSSQKSASTSKVKHRDATGGSSGGGDLSTRGARGPQ